MADFIIRDQIIDIAGKYAEVLKKEFIIHGLYLYDSYVKGTFTSDSDIDIAVIAENLSGDLFEDTLKLMKYRRIVDYRIEPHPFLVSELKLIR